jgi:hypothetical protein
MPFKSDAQRRKFYATPSLHKYIPEYEAATGDKKLPARLHNHRRRKHRRGQASPLTRAMIGKQ